jgi:DNA-binding CsgD family transcriptional regulator
MSSGVSKKLVLLEQWSRGIAEITTVQGPEQFIAALLTGVKRLVDIDFLMVFAYRGSSTPLLLGDTLDAARHRIIANDYAAGPFMLDPFFRLVNQGQRSGCHRLRDIAPDHFRRSEYFRLHYSRTGIAEELGVYFDLGGGLTGVTSFARWNGSPPVLRGEIEILQAIAPAIGALCATQWQNVHGVHELSQRAAQERPGFRALSAREREIVTLILQGHSTESIALQLDISPGTVKIHRKNIYRKMCISTQAELFSAFMGLSTPALVQHAYSPRDMAPAREITHARRKAV